MNRRISVAAWLLCVFVTSSAIAACPGGPTLSFTVTGAVKKPLAFYLNDLQRLPPAQANVTYFAAGSVASQTFGGALLWDLLNKSPVGGIVTDPNAKNDILHKIVIVTGSDCYQAVFGVGELDPLFGGSQVMVAYAVGGQSLGPAGFARIVAPGDKAGGRFVSNIVNIDVENGGRRPGAPR